jgi:hypothetical protein
LGRFEAFDRATVGHLYVLVAGLVSLCDATEHLPAGLVGRGTAVQ